MTDAGPDGPVDAPARAERIRAGSVTRGFLFADLRGYTHFVESHGAAAAADLLTRYRAVVRTAIHRFDGAEIRTEGDSFYVVFGSVSDAVQCGLTIVSDAAARTAELPEEPIKVGVGVHAGETVETPEGYVGVPVNVAARLCALAAPGQVLVSDTVRTLTQTVLPVAFRSVGKRQLKGVTDPVAVYAAIATDPVKGSWHVDPARADARRRRRRYGAIAGVAVVIAAVALGGYFAFRPRAGLPAGPWTIGLDGQLTGGADPDHLTPDAVQLAIDEQNAKGGIGGQPLRLDSRDDADADGGADPAKAEANAKAFIADPSVVAVIGSRGSPSAKVMIPLTNAAGLLQCSQANSYPGLTKPREGALDLRSAAPDRINYVRVWPSDDIEGVAAARFAFDDLKARSSLVIDDTFSAYGRPSADAFAAAFGALGGKVVRRSLNQQGSGVPPLPSDVASVLDPLTAPGSEIDLVYFGGLGDTGAPEVRNAMVTGGKASVPFVSTDGILDGSGKDVGSFIQRTGANGAGSYSLLPAIPPVKADFTQRFQQRFGQPPDEIADAAYACAQVILRGLDRIAPSGPTAAGLREALRASVVDPSHQVDTVLGTVAFDANGDDVHQFVTVFQDQPTVNGGAGDWVTLKQQDFGPAP